MDVILNSTVTLLVKCFMRPEHERECISSAQKMFPGIQVLTNHWENWSSGRNDLLDRCTTPFFLLCDEDFSFRDVEWDLTELCHQLDEDDKMFYCGRVREDGEFTREYEAEFIWDDAERGLVCKKIERQDYMRVHLGLQFGLGKTSMKARWDENIDDSSEHIAWFLNMWRLDERVAYVDKLWCHHRPAWVSEPINENFDYAKHRDMKKVGPGTGYLLNLWNLAWIRKPDAEVKHELKDSQLVFQYLVNKFHEQFKRFPTRDILIETTLLNKIQERLSVEEIDQYMPDLLRCQKELYGDEDTRTKLHS